MTLRECHAIDHSTAEALVAEVIRRALEDGGKPVAVAVGDSAGMPLALARMDGAAPHTAMIALAKIRTAAFTESDTLRHHWRGIDPANWGRSAGELTAFGGGRVLYDECGCIVGTISVSARAAEQDHDLTNALPPKLGVRTSNDWMLEMDPPSREQHAMARGRLRTDPARRPGGGS